MFGEMAFGSIQFRENYFRTHEVSVIRRFYYVTIQSKDVRWCFFSAKQRFGKMTFRENDPAPKITNNIINHIEFYEDCPFKIPMLSCPISIVLTLICIYIEFSIELLNFQCEIYGFLLLNPVFNFHITMYSKQMINFITFFTV